MQVNKSGSSINSPDKSGCIHLMRSNIAAFSLACCVLFIADIPYHSEAFNSKSSQLAQRKRLFTNRGVEVEPNPPSSPKGSVVWNAIKRKVPAVVTGAWVPTDGDKNPGAAIYNLVFVRVPILVGGVWYASFVFHGQHLLVDFGFGGGQTEIPPLVMAVTIGLMLL
jgi:hypothetical protein